MKYIRDILSSKGSDIISLKLDSSLDTAARLLAEKGIGAVVVLDNEGVLKGILSERDIVLALGHGKTCSEILVGDGMTSDLTTAEPGDSITHCLQLMTDRRHRHLPVLDGGTLVGIVSIGDLVKAQLKEQAALIEQLNQYITGVPG